MTKKNKQPKLPRAPRPPRTGYNWRRKILLIIAIAGISATLCYVVSTYSPKTTNPNALWTSRNGDYEVSLVPPGYYFFDHKREQFLGDIVAFNIEQKKVLYMQNGRGECFRFYTKTGKIDSWDDIDSAPQELRKFFETYCYEAELPPDVAASVVARYYRNRYVVFKKEDGREFFWASPSVESDFEPEQKSYFSGEREVQSYSFDKETRKLNLTFVDGTEMTVPQFPLFNKIDGKEIFK